MPSFCYFERVKLAGYMAEWAHTFTLFLTGTATPTITPGTPPVDTMPPPSDPLEVYFANNTPHVVENTVTVHVHTNKPASATCRLGRVATMPCKQFIQYHKNPRLCHAQGFAYPWFHAQGHREDCRGKYKEWGPYSCVRRVLGHAPRRFWDFQRFALKCVLGASEAPFHACIQYIHTYQLPSLFSSFRSKSTTYGALVSGCAVASHIR